MVGKKLIIWCFLFGVLLLCSCAELDTILEYMESSENTENVIVDDSKPKGGKLEGLAPVKKYTVIFDENEEFSDELSKRAAEHIDPSIRTAAELLNSIDGEQYHVLECDYQERPKQRDAIENPLTLELYDTILEKTQAFEDYYFDERDYESDSFFSDLITAKDALRIDHREIFLYSDIILGSQTYTAGYYMPGNWLDNVCDDRNAVKEEVSFFNHVVDRIIDKMPDGLTNYEKCCYFAFVIAVTAETDYDMSSIANYFQVYDALINKEAVCQGYAQSFYYLCREVGISCWYCSGTASADNDPHAWNCIDTEEGSVYVDVTWYDDDSIDDDYRDGKHQYLFMTPEKLEYYGYKLQDIGWK